jgi:hypothetical protein
MEKAIGESARHNKRVIIKASILAAFHLKGRACGGDISDPSKSILENPS